MGNGQAKLKLVMEIDGDKVVVSGLERVDSAVERTASTTSNATGRMAAGMNDVSASTGRMAADMSGLETVIQRVVAAWGTWELLKQGEAAIMFAANVQQADRALGVIGNTTGHTVAEMYKYRDAVRDLNITTSTATNTTAQFARSKLPLEKLTQLATGAQGAAIAYSMMGGEVISSSQALDKIVRAILTLQTVELHQMGIMVSQREILRENGMGISEHQRKQELLAKVLEQLAPLNTLYAESQDLAAKKIASSKRPVEELKLALGELFLPELNAAASTFYDTVSGGMKWVRAHRDELTSTRNVVWDLTDTVKIGAGFIGIYFLAFGGYTLVTNASGALVLFNSLLTVMTTNVSLTGAAATTTATQIGMMGETVTGATTAGTIGFLSMKAAASSLFAFIAGYQIGKYLYNEFEVVRNAGTQMVWGLMRGWGEFVYVLKEAKSVLSNMFDQDEMDAQLQKINAEREKWRQEWRQSKADQLADNAKPAATGAPAARQYGDNAAAIAAGIETEKQRKAAEAAEVARQAQDLAEKQAKYDKQVADAKAAVVKQYNDNERRLLDAQTKAKLSQLEYEKEMGLRTVQSYLDEKYSLEQETYTKERDDASKQVISLQKTLDAMKANPAIDTLLFKQEEHKLAQAKGELALLEEKLRELKQSMPREQGKNDYAQTKQLSELNIQLMEISGHYEEAARAKAALEKNSPEYKRATTEIQAQKDAISLWNIEEGRHKDIITQVSAAIAALENQLTRIDQAEKTYAITPAEAAARRIGLYQQELDQQQKLYDSIMGTEPATIQLRQQTLDKITQINGKLQDQQKIVRDSTALGGAIAAMQEYARAAEDAGAQTKNLVSNTFKGLEDSIVGIFRKGRLEIQSLLNSIADDIARIFVRQSITGPLAGMLTSLMAGTSSAFASASPMSGFDTAGNAMASFAPGTIGAFLSGSAAPVSNAVSTGAASGVASGMATAAPYFAAAAGVYAAYSFGKSYFSGNSDGSWGSHTSGQKSAIAASSIYTMGMAPLWDKLTGGGLFGTNWKTTGSGLSLGISDGGLDAQYYEDQKKKKSWFRGNSYHTNYSDVEEPMQEFLTGQLQAVFKNITTGSSTLGRSADLSGFSSTTTKISLAGLSAADQEKAITKYFNDISNEALNKMYGNISTYSKLGEDATQTFNRLTGSLKLVNDNFALLDVPLNQLGLEGAAAASALVDAFGGLQQAKSGFAAYLNSDLFTQSEKDAMKLAAAQNDVSAVFKKLGDDVIPQTNEEFKAMVKYQLSLGASGADAAVALMSVANEFALTTKTADTAAIALEKLNAQKALDANISDRTLRAKGQIDLADFIKLLTTQENELQAARAKGLDVTRLLALQQLELGNAMQAMADKVALAAQSVKTAERSYSDLLAQQALNIAKTNAAAAQSSWSGADKLATTYEGKSTEYTTARTSYENLLVQKYNTLNTAAENSATKLLDIQKRYDALKIQAAQEAGAAQASIAKASTEQMIGIQRNAVTALKEVLAISMASATPAAQYNQSRADFFSTAANAGAGSASAAADLSATVKTFLTSSQAFSATREDYLRDVSSAQTALAKVAAIPDATARQLNLLQLQLDSLQAIQNSLASSTTTSTTAASLDSTSAELTAMTAQAAAEKAAAVDFGKIVIDLFGAGALVPQTIDTQIAAAKVLMDSLKDYPALAISQRAIADELKLTADSTAAIVTSLEAAATALANQDLATKISEAAAAVTAAGSNLAAVMGQQAAVTAVNTAHAAAQAERSRLEQLISSVAAKMNSVPFYERGSYINQLDTLTSNLASLPQYAAGTPWVEGDQVAQIHHGEAVIDNASMAVLRKYGIPAAGTVDNSELVAEIRELRMELRAQNGQTAVYAQKTAKILDKWDGDGMPPVAP